MNPAVTPEDLFAAANATRTTFGTTPTRTASVADPARLTPAEDGEIVRRYTAHGFAIFQVTSAPTTAGLLCDIAESLCLGEPFVPPLYRTNGAQAAPVSRISAARNAGTPDAGHPSFGRTVGQALHCDGTLQDIGYVKASLLLCENPAADGGDTILFNSCAAFAALVEADPRAALALAAPGALIRRATIYDSTEVNAGPAFTVQDGVLVGRYCVTETDAWAVPAADLHRGVEFLARASRPGSPYFLQLRLDRGQVIVFDNTRVSHGRTAYVDSATAHRCMYRSLHLRHPGGSARAVASGPSSLPERLG